MASRTSLSLACLVLGLGCSRPTMVLAKPVEVRIPVPVPCPEPPSLELPDLPVYKLTSTSSDKETVQAYVESTLILQEWVKRAKRYLDVYRNQPKPVERP